MLIWRRFRWKKVVPYLGKSPKLDNLQRLHILIYFFQEVTAPIRETNSSVTCNHWCTSFPLNQRMLKEPFPMTMIRTVKKKWTRSSVGHEDCRENPSEYQILSHCRYDEILHDQKKNIMLVVSSHTKSQEDTNGKLNTNFFYNNTKRGKRHLTQKIIAKQQHWSAWKNSLAISFLHKCERDWIAIAYAWT